MFIKKFRPASLQLLHISAGLFIYFQQSQLATANDVCAAVAVTDAKASPHNKCEDSSNQLRTSVETISRAKVAGRSSGNITMMN